MCRSPFMTSNGIYPVKLIFVAVTLHGAEFVMSTRVYHIAGLSSHISSTATSLNNFQGRLQGLVVNGERIFDEAHLKQIQYEGMNILNFRYIRMQIWLFSKHHIFK